MSEWLKSLDEYRNRQWTVEKIKAEKASIANELRLRADEIDRNPGFFGSFTRRNIFTRNETENLLRTYTTILEEKELELKAIRAKEDRERSEREARMAPILRLRAATRTEKQYLDPSYRERFAKSSNQIILTKYRIRWASEAEAVLGDESVLKLAKREAPEVLDLIKARENIVSLAEGFSVPQEKETPEQFRQRTAMYERNKLNDELCAVDIVLEKLAALDQRIALVKNDETISEETRAAQLAFLERMKKLLGRDEGSTDESDTII